VENLCQTIKEGPVKVQSVFTHLVASEDPQEDEFTHLQAKRFKDAADRMEKILGYSFIRHIANTAAISRHPKYHLNMVRLGAGLYGFDSRIKELAQVSSLRTTVAQIRMVAKGETVSYNRRGKVLRDSRIATIRIGYADGYPRNLGNGAGEVVVKGQRAPIVGTICMDMTMIDVTDVPGVQEGDEVLLFGSELPLPELAAKAQTLPHEIISRIADRVKRIYIEE
ncbi:MAG: alanine racemase, partial [Chitinophagaceae bacterium]